MAVSTEPDFSSVIEEQVTLPHEPNKTFLKLTYSDPILKNYSLIVVADTVATSLAPISREEEKARISTFVPRYPRYVHAEFLRHRVISRNASSSRARSVRSTLSEVMNEPVIPIFTVNQKGMGGKYPTPEVREALVKEWLLARDRDVTSVLSMLVNPSIAEGRTPTEVANDYEAILDDYYANGYDANGEPKPGYLSAHKQNFNRLIEAHTVFEEVITATNWDNFLELRDHDDAQPEIRAIAVLIREALKRSTPVEHWIHLPFIAEQDIPAEPVPYLEVKPLMMLSATECAQISYGDKTKAKKSTATLTLGERLFESKHYSPFEHPAISSYKFDHAYTDGFADGLVEDYECLDSNFDYRWYQFRILLAGVTK